MRNRPSKDVDGELPGNDDWPIEREKKESRELRVDIQVLEWYRGGEGSGFGN